MKKFTVTGPSFEVAPAKFTDETLYYLYDDSDADCIAIAALEVGETHVDEDGDTWERTE